MVLSNKSLLGYKLIDLTFSDNIAPAGNKISSLRPPIGQLYNLVGLSYHATDPAGSAAGTHTIFLTIGGETASKYNHGYTEANTGTNITMGWRGGSFTGSTLSPANAREQLQFCKGFLWASNTNYIDIRYVNGTDVTQTADVELKNFVLVYSEALE